MKRNYDQKVLDSFGEEWKKFDQTQLSQLDEQAMFKDYFAIFPWHILPENSIGFDLGCGSGRWAKLVAPRVGLLHCIDASAQALEVAKKNLQHYSNCQFHLASVDSIPLQDESADFGYSLGVLHHIPDTGEGIKACVKKLKCGAPFLLYLYYNFDNKPIWYRLIWKATEIFRFIISRCPFSIRYILSQGIAIFVYWPLAKLASLAELTGINIDSFPLSYYRKTSFYVMRTDALDRFGTSLEKRFSKKQITEMMEKAGLVNIIFSSNRPYWCALGEKR